jgi:hypothetical protein
VHVYVRFTKLVLIVRVTTYDLRQVTSPIAEVKRYRIVYSNGFGRVRTLRWFRQWIERDEKNMQSTCIHEWLMNLLLV